MSLGMSTMELLVIAVIVVLIFALGRWLSRRTKKEPRPPTPSSSIRDTSTARPAARDRLPRPFADVERQVEVLRRQVRDSLLTKEECKARMRELMVEDMDGNWWMVGYETNEWYRHDGTDWVRADPPTGPR